MPAHQLRFYSVSDYKNDQSLLTPYKIVDGNWFAKEGGDVKGALFYDDNYHLLIAISKMGIYVVDLEGNTLAGNSDGNQRVSWQYNVLSHQFYAIKEKKVVVIDYQHWFEQNKFITQS